MPFRAVTELILHDKHPGVIESRIHEVGVWDVGRESIGPSGLPQRGNVIQPRVERSDTLGTRKVMFINPNGVGAIRHAPTAATPLGLRTVSMDHPG